MAGGYLGETKGGDTVAVTCLCRSIQLCGSRLAAAIVDIRKLTGYCLDPEHPRGKHKARVFASVLGLTAAQAELLRSALHEAAASGEAQPSLADQFGER